MSRLDDLYKAMETLRREGLPVNEDLEQKANEIEEDIIKKERLKGIDAGIVDQDVQSPELSGGLGH